MSVAWIVDYLSIFALCILIIGVAIPRVQLLAYRKKLLDTSIKRKVHKAPTPRLGGIDGLVSSLCIVSFVCYGIAFVFCIQNIYALLSFAFVGVLITFFYYNVFGTQRKRKIFMGDTGSLTLGMMLCFLNIKLTQMPQDSLPHINKYLLAALPLMIPCFDVVRVFAYRLHNHDHHHTVIGPAHLDQCDAVQRFGGYVAAGSRHHFLDSGQHHHRPVAETQRKKN